MTESPYFTPVEAADYLRFKSINAFRIYCCRERKAGRELKPHLIRSRRVYLKSDIFKRATKARPTADPVNATAAKNEREATHGA